MSRSIRIFTVFSIVFTAPVRAQEPGAAPDAAALARAGKASIARLEKEPASWTATHRTPAGVEFVVEVLATPEARRLVLSVEAQGRREELARLIQRGDVWYMIQGAHAGKYRPYEAPLDMPTGYLFLGRSEPRFVTEADLSAIGSYEKTSDGVATYRGALPEPLKAQLRNYLAEYEQFKKQNAEKAANAELEQKFETVKDLLAKGTSTEVELKSGLVLQFGAPDRRTTIRDFQWGSRVDPKEFATDGRRWNDFTDDPTAGDLDDLLMMGHSGVWRPGMRSHDTDGRLLDVKTGRFRRVPFQGDLTLPGCFTKDRRRVVVTGVDSLSGAMRLYEIDLKTGENRRLGGESLTNGLSLFPSLSPDGKTVAVLHKGATERILQAQIYLVDLKAGDARPLGEPRDTGLLSWFPDGQALLIVDRKSEEASKPKIETVCRLGLDGTLTPLFEGNSPVILGDGKAILFEDATRTWKACDLDGRNTRTYADGMKGHAFPSPSPDGKRLLMMRFEPGQAPQPMVFPLNQAEGKPATTAPGLWVTPAWR